jgi:hypothetical protein
MALEEIKPEFRASIIDRCQDENPIGDGIQCPHCGALEAYKNRENPRDTTKWSWMVRAFKIDDYSHCRNCDKWFGL